MLKMTFLVLLHAALVIGAEQTPWAATKPLNEITGLKIPTDWKMRAPFLGDLPKRHSAINLPRKFDWRECGNLPPVNQQLWNDCWAQGTAAVLEILAELHKVRGSDRASVQEIIDCSGEGTARSGGYFAHEMHKVKGGAVSVDYPYRGNDGRCRGGVSARWKLARWGYVGQRGRRPTTEEMKEAIYAHGPIGVTIYANSALQRFTGDGVFRGCQNGGTNHIEVIVGWDDDEGVWFVRNSWGPSHGKDGYAKIPYGCSRIGEVSTWADLH